MKRTLKKVLSWALVLCMLLAVVPFAAFADEAPETITFDFTGLVTEGSKNLGNPTSLLYNKVDYGRNWKISMCQNLEWIAYPEYSDVTLKVRENQIQAQQPYRWFIMYTLYGIDPGMYTVELNLVGNDDATKTFPAEMYFMPQSEMTHINTSGPMGKMSNMEPVGTFNSGEEKVTVKNIAFSDDPNGTYYIMINADHMQNDLHETNMKLKSLVLTKAGKPAPKPTEPTIPDFNTPEDPADDAGSFPVVPVVIAAVAVIAVAAVVVIVISKKKKNNAE